jgi:hypothetical protein
MDRLSQFIENIVVFIIQPIIALLFVLAIAYFTWGIVRFIFNADNPEERKKGQQAIIWGILGIFIISATIGILAILTNTFGV